MNWKSFALLLVLAAACPLNAAEPDPAAGPSVLSFSPGVEAEDNARVWQGIPGIERAPNGRLWAIWYSGAKSEGLPGNYCIVATSGDDGTTWSKPVLLIKGPTPQSSTFDAVPWLDPKGRLWLFYVQAVRDSTYPDSTQAPDGRIFVTYDSWRYGCQPGVFRYDPDAGPGKEIAMALIREGDIRAGETVSPDSRLRQLINRATGYGNTIELKKANEQKTREEVNKKLPIGKTSPAQKH